MKTQREIFHLKKHILNYVEDLLGQRLLHFIYYDVCAEDELSTNNNGIDIIAHQLQLNFENKEPDRKSVV